MDLLHRHKVTSAGCQIKQTLKSGLKTRSRFLLRESDPKIDAATGVNHVGMWASKVNTSHKMNSSLLHVFIPRLFDL